MGYPGTNPSALAWTRVCRAAVDLAAAWAEFKLALDDYALITRGGQLPFGDSNQDRTPDESDPAKEHDA